MQSYTFSSTLIGIEAHLVRVEVALSNGLPGLLVVGLPDTAVSEAGARVRSALKASGFNLPPRRVVVNLSPADLRKQGAGFDLALALGWLEAAGELPPNCLSRSLALGELSLDGSIRPVRGLVPVLATAASAPEVDRVLASKDQQGLELASDCLQVIPLASLSQAVDFLKGKPCATVAGLAPTVAVKRYAWQRDMCEVQQQEMARWAVELSAAGGHHLMMVGPPGCGKSLLASCLPGILPPLSGQEWLEVASIASVCQDEISLSRPFRSPGQATSAIAMLGGLQPGEVTRAHHGVLFLDEFPEFRRDTLEALRQVMERGVSSVVRARFCVNYPAKFTLVAAMNPCPCGMDGPACRCTEAQRQRYAGKLSGPLRDRFDLLVALQRQPLTTFLSAAKPSQSSAEVRERVIVARARQEARGKLNCDLKGVALRDSLSLCSLDQSFCESTGERLGLSMRGLEKWLKVSRTIADLKGEAKVQREHLLSALALRTPESARRLAS